MIRIMESPPAVERQIRIVNKFVGEAFGPPHGSPVRVVFAGAAEDTQQREDRIILLISPNTQEKETCIDALCNFFYGVNREDQFRFHIANEKFDRSTPNKAIITYVFNDTKMPFRPIVVDVKDNESSLLLKWMESNCRLRIDVVCVILSTVGRLDSIHEDSVKEKLTLIPSWMRSNVCVFLSDSDGSVPYNPLLRRLNLHESPLFKANWTTLFQDQQNDSLKEYLRANYWRMTEGSFSALISLLEEELKPQTYSGLPFEPPRFVLYLKPDNLSPDSSSSSNSTSSTQIDVKKETTHSSEIRITSTTLTSSIPPAPPLHPSVPFYDLPPPPPQYDLPPMMDPVQGRREPSPTLTKVVISQTSSTQVEEKIVEMPTGIPAELLREIEERSRSPDGNEHIVVKETITVTMTKEDREEKEEMERRRWEHEGRRRREEEERRRKEEEREELRRREEEREELRRREEEARRMLERDREERRIREEKEREERLRIEREERIRTEREREEIRIRIEKEKEERLREEMRIVEEKMKEERRREEEERRREEEERRREEEERRREEARLMKERLREERLKERMREEPRSPSAFERIVKTTYERTVETTRNDKVQERIVDTLPSAMDAASTYLTRTYVNGDAPLVQSSDSSPGSVAQSVRLDSRDPCGRSRHNEIPIGDSPMVRFVYDENNRKYVHHIVQGSSENRHQSPPSHPPPTIPSPPQILSRTETLIDDPFTPPQSPPNHAPVHSKPDNGRSPSFKRDSPARTGVHRMSSPSRDDQNGEKYQFVMSPTDLRSPGMTKTPIGLSSPEMSRRQTVLQQTSIDVQRESYPSGRRGREKERGNRNDHQYQNLPGEDDDDINQYIIPAKMRKSQSPIVMRVQMSPKEGSGGGEPRISWRKSDPSTEHGATLPRMYRDSQRNSQIDYSRMVAGLVIEGMQQRAPPEQPEPILHRHSIQQPPIPAHRRSLNKPIGGLPPPIAPVLKTPMTQSNPPPPYIQRPRQMSESEMHQQQRQSIPVALERPTRLPGTQEEERRQQQGSAPLAQGEWMRDDGMGQEERDLLLRLRPMDQFQREKPVEPDWQYRMEPPRGPPPAWESPQDMEGGKRRRDRRVVRRPRYTLSQRLCLMFRRRTGDPPLECCDYVLPIFCFFIAPFIIVLMILTLILVFTLGNH